MSKTHFDKLLGVFRIMDEFHEFGGVVHEAFTHVGIEGHELVFGLDDDVESLLIGRCVRNVSEDLLGFGAGEYACALEGFEDVVDVTGRGLRLIGATWVAGEVDTRIFVRF